MNLFRHISSVFYQQLIEQTLLTILSVKRSDDIIKTVDFVTHCHFFGYGYDTADWQRVFREDNNDCND